MRKQLSITILCTVFSLSAQFSSKEERSFVDRFVTAAQQHIDDIVSQVDSAYIPIMGSLAVMSGSATLKQLRENHQTFLTQQLPEDESGEVMRIAAYGKLAVPLILRMNEQLIAQLARIDELLLYWRYQEEHRLYYLCHKDPTKFISEDQFEEAEKKVHALERLQEHYYTVLGSLLVHLSTFSVEADAKQQEMWLKELLCAIITIVPKQGAPKLDASLDCFFTKAIKVAGMMSRSFEKQITPLGIPSWYKRYWMATTATTMSTFLTGRSLYRNRESIEGGVERAMQGAKGYKDQIAGALQRDKKWGEGLEQDKKSLERDYKKGLLELLPYFTKDDTARRKILEQIVNDKLKEGEVAVKIDTSVSPQSQETFKSDLRLIATAVNRNKGFDSNRNIDGLSEGCDPLETFYRGIFDRPLPEPKHYLSSLDSTKLNKFTIKDIDQASATLSLEYMEEVIFPLIADDYKNGGQDLKETAAHSQRVIENIDVSLKANVWSSAPPEGRFTINTAIQRIGTACKNLPALANTILTTPSAGLLYLRCAIWHLKKCLYNGWQKNKLFFLLIGGTAALWPIYKSMEFGWRSYKWWCGTESYEELMYALTGLMRMFIQYGDAHPTEMDHEDVGIIHYLAHKLELEGQKVPKKYRKSFMHDVQLVQSSNFSPGQKHHIIRDVILNKYPFLRKHSIAEIA